MILHTAASTVHIFCEHIKVTCSKATVTARTDTAAALVTVEGTERIEESFQRWADQAGIKAPKLQHAVFVDPLVGDLR